MKNYQSWSRVMVLAHTTIKKMSFVNGKISKPDLDSPLYEDWESCNTMVLSWLINSMAHMIHHSQILLLCLLVPKAPILEMPIGIRKMAKRRDLYALTAIYLVTLWTSVTNLLCNHV